MEIVQQILEILKYVLPSLVVLFACYYIVKRFLDQQQHKALLEIRRMNQGTITPLRLQAYERAVLFLERISPNSLVMRTQKQGMNARELHQELLGAIRAEYEHNLTQQIYITDGAWEAVKRAKEETIKLINISASKTSDNASAMDLSKIILEISMQIERLPTQGAIDIIKSEVRTLY